VRKQVELNGGLMLAMLGAGVLLVPSMGWMPLVTIAVACGTSVYIVKRFNDRR
jgi:hypothetical protein